MNNKFKLLLTFAVIFLISCNQDSVKISGVFHGKPDETIYIEQLSPNKKIIDSVKTNSSGDFSYKYKLMDDELAKFINIKLEDKFITLLVEKGENIKINSIFNIPAGYSVEGSEGSQLVKSLNEAVVKSSHKIDSLYNLFNTFSDPTHRKNISTQISQAYVNHKRENIKFIVENSKSLASIMALYQQMPNGIVVFNDSSDVPYFRLVADSLKEIYPNSSHVKTLLSDIEQIQNSNSVNEMINSALNSGTETSVPEIQMKDMHEKEQKLSDLKGKVVLLSFWSANDNSSAMINSELKEIYNTYKDKGFEIFQISIDQDKQQWVSAINRQALPWISVNDFKGSLSPVVNNYNVRQVPTNYLISRDGEIVGKNIFGADLVTSITRQL